MSLICADTKNDFTAGVSTIGVSRGCVGGILFRSEKVAANISKR